MNITIFTNKNEFSKEQLNRLDAIGEVRYSNTRKPLSFEEILKLSKNAQILAIDPNNFGGFEKAKEFVNKLVNTLPDPKGIALSTTSYGWVDTNYLRTKNISVCNIPNYSRESVAEHVLALLLCASKRIITTDRKTQNNNYGITLGQELKDKTLGILGLGSIGSRVAELGNAVGMNVIAYNRSQKKQKNVAMVNFDELLRRSDAISINVTDSKENENLISKKEISKMKQGVFIVNTVDRKIFNEDDMVEALRSGKVDAYVYEAEDLTNTPLSGIETAIGLKGFGWYTKESIENLAQIWVDNIVSLAKISLRTELISTLKD